MQWSDDDLREAARAGVISAADLQRLTTFLSKRQPAAPANAAATVVKFDAAHLLWYAGALIVIGAMGIFSTVAFSQMGGRALTVCAIIYAIAFTLAGHHLWHRKNLQVPGGLLITDAVSMAARGLRHSRRAWLVGLVREAGHSTRLLCVDERQLDFHGDCGHRRGGHRVVLLPVSIHCLDYSGRTVVHVDGPDAMDLQHSPS